MVGAASLLCAGAYEAFRAWRDSPSKVSQDSATEHQKQSGSAPQAGSPAQLPPPKAPSANSTADHVQKFLKLSRKARWYK